MSVRQIAKLAELSVTTVSFALRDNPKIPSATRLRVKQIARKCGYTINPRVSQLMSAIRLGRRGDAHDCIGVISFYDSPRPWEGSVHLSRLYDGMVRRADALGYRLEPMWLRAPGMTARRFRSILDARGVEGLLCFGSPNIDERLPKEFDHYAIVAQGSSVRTPLHRVINNAFGDTQRALCQAQKLGYRRPGLVVSEYEHNRAAHANVSAYLGWCHHYLGVPDLVPVFVTNGTNDGAVCDWIESTRPDVVIFVDQQESIARCVSMMERNGLSVPEDVGILALSQLLDGTGIAGLAENQGLMGAWAVELLVARIMNRDLGIPARPRVEMVDGVWVKGCSLRQVRSPRS